MALPSLENKEKSVQAMFTSIAPCYDLNNSILSFGLHHRWKREAVSVLSPPAGGRVLDLCSGTGDLVMLIGRRFRSLSSISALDLNGAMLRLGRQKIAGSNLAIPVGFTIGNASVLPYQPSSFDAVTIAFGIRNVTDQEGALREILRVLRPGGRLVCLEFSVPRNRMVRWIYDLYSYYWIPWIASRLSRDRTGTYDYLPASIRAFHDPGSFTSLLEKVGFSNIRYRSRSFGIVAIYSADRPVA